MTPDRGLSDCKQSHNSCQRSDLSAGSVSTPHILLNSGIGPSAQLKSVSVMPIIDHPSIGANLTNRPLLTNVFTINGTRTYDEFK